jgi:hypothetical protein
VEEDVTELEYLERDLDWTLSLWRSDTVGASLTREGSSEEKNTRFVLGDYSIRSLHLARATFLMLHEGLRDATLTLQRSLVEALVGMNYLVKHTNREEEALILRAFAYTAQIRIADSEGERTSRQVVLAKIPERIRKEASRRLDRKPHTWSGKSITRMAEEANVTQFRELYHFLSLEAHAHVTGANLSSNNVDGQTLIQFGSSMSPETIEIRANFTRRALRDSLLMTCSIFQLPYPSRVTPDPEIWVTRLRSVT